MNSNTAEEYCVVNKNRNAWTDEGRVDLRKSVLIFEEPKGLLVRRSLFGRAGERFLSPGVFRVSLCRHLKHARRVKHARVYACYPPWPIHCSIH